MIIISPAILIEPGLGSVPNNKYDSFLRPIWSNHEAYLSRDVWFIAWKFLLPQTQRSWIREGGPETLLSMADWVESGYPVIASFKVPLQGGIRSPNVLSKREQSNAEKSGRVAGVGNSSLRPGSMS